MPVRQARPPPRRMEDAAVTTLPFKLMIEPTSTQVLLTVRGEMNAASREAGRTAHNMAAGSDEGVAAARSLGDLSHAVFVPVDTPASGPGELLIVDYWNSLDGLMRFFADEQVQQGGAMLFKAREPVVWASTPGMPHFNLPAPTGRNERWLGIVRGPVRSPAAAEETLRRSLVKSANTARAKGLMIREWYMRADRPDVSEIIGIDLWFDADGMQQVYADPDEMAVFADLFTARPQTSVWRKPEGQWTEW